MERDFTFGEFRLDTRSRVLFLRGEIVSLYPKAIDILILLVEKQGNVVGKDELLERIWPNTFVEDGTVTRGISVLRKALGDTQEGQKYIVTIPKRGYRFVAPVEAVSAPAPRYTAGRILLAVLPFENLSGNRRHDYFSEGLTEEMITQLGRLNPDHLSVIARTSAMHYKSTDKTIQQIGRELGVSMILEGSVRRVRNRVRITAQLIQVSDQTHLWAESYERDLVDILALQCDVSQAIAREIEIKLVPHARMRLGRFIEVQPRAYEAYLKGRYFWNRRTPESLQKGLHYFGKAIQHDPRFAAAYAGLADSYLTLQDDGIILPREGTTRAIAAAEKALQMDEWLADAHISLAHAHFHEFNWPVAEREFKRGIALNPSYAIAHFYYANYLVALRRTDEAILHARCAQGLDPVSLTAETNMAAILYHSGRYDEAISRAAKVLEMDSTFARAHEDLGRSYEQKGMYERAIAAFRKAVVYSGRSAGYLASLAYGYAVAGRRKEAVKLLQELRQISKIRYVSAYAFALVFVGLGNRVQAINWLAKAYRERASALPFLNVNPRLAPLRSHLGFRKLLRRLGLVAEAGPGATA